MTPLVCAKCGAKLSPSDSVCMDCGAAVGRATTPAQPAPGGKPAAGMCELCGTRAAEVEGQVRSATERVLAPREPGGDSGDASSVALGIGVAMVTGSGLLGGLAREAMGGGRTEAPAPRAQSREGTEPLMVCRQCATTIKRAAEDWNKIWTRGGYAGRWRHLAQQFARNGAVRSVSAKQIAFGAMGGTKLDLFVDVPGASLSVDRVWPQRRREHLAAHTKSVLKR